MILDYYQLLGVAPNASKAEIRKAYKRAARKFHPDKGGTHEAFVALQRAYETLKDEDRREMYDLGQRQGINPQEFQQILNGFVQKICNHVLAELDVQGGYGNLRRAIEKQIGSERNEIVENEQTARSKLDFIDRQLKSVKSGKKARLVQAIERMREAIAGSLQSLEHNRIVLDFLMQDSEQIVVEAMMPDPKQRLKMRKTTFAGLKMENST